MAVDTSALTGKRTSGLNLSALTKTLKTPEEIKELPGRELRVAYTKT